MLWFTALWLAERVAFDVAAARLSARRGVVVVGCGKGDAFRGVPLDAEVRAR